jgi:hypothetical protein
MSSFVLAVHQPRQGRRFWHDDVCGKTPYVLAEKENLNLGSRENEKVSSFSYF